MRLAFLAATAIAWLAAGARPAAAGTVRGTVFADADGDGVLDRDERGVATIVSWEGAVFVPTAADGTFALDVPGEGFVWARVPAGYRPAPVYQLARAAGDEVVIDLALQPLAPEVAASPLRFVVAADTHLHADQHNFGDAELRDAIAQATAGAPPPRFFTILGDVTQSNQPQELDQIARATADLAVPWVPVAGNHDWYDGGAAWRARFGPEAYSFAIDDVHFVVANTTAEVTDIAGFLERDLATVDPAAMIVVLAHAPQPREVIEVMERLGVDLFLAGHWHANRVVDHGALVELDTEPFLMGGMDFTPAGYRVVTIEGHAVDVEHRTVVTTPFLELVAPHVSRCARPGDPLIVSAAVDARALHVTAHLGGHSVPLTPSGEWSHVGTIPELPPGHHPVHLSATAPTVSDPVIVSDTAVAICAEPQEKIGAAASWTQVGGDAAHRGFVETAIGLPVAETWAANIGGPIVGVVAWQRTAFVLTTDLARGETGALVSLDLATGETRWRAPLSTSSRGGPVVVDAGGRALVVVVQSDAVVVAYDADGGQEQWRRDLGRGLDPMVRTTFAPAVADRGRLWAGGQRRFAELDPTTGAVLWSVDPVPDAVWHTTLAPATIADGRIIATFERSRGGLFGWHLDGSRAWNVPAAHVMSTNAAVAVADGIAYVATGMGDLLSVDVNDGAVRWSRVLTDDRHDWAYAVAASPVVGSDTVVVATMHGRVWALDRATGDAKWTWDAPESRVYPAHYRGRARAIAAAPVLTGATLWVAARDGSLTALDLQTGEVLQTLALGAPVMAGLAVAGDQILVGALDGNVHAFGPAIDRASPRDARSAWLELAALVIAAATAIMRRRRLVRT